MSAVAGAAGGPPGDAAPARGDIAAEMVEPVVHV